MTRRRPGYGLLVAGLAWLCCVPASAQDRAGTAADDTAAWSSIEDSGLAAVTGKADIAQVVANDLKAGVQGNAVTGDVNSGGVAFGDSALRGANGLFIVNANTGNNVAINTALSVNVVVKP